MPFDTEAAATASGTRTSAPPIRVGIVCDLLEERWASMDLVAEHLVTGLRARRTGVEPIVLRPAMRRRLTAVPGIGGWSRAAILDRLVNRHVDYPAWLSRDDSGCDVYHVVDHSYAHLVTRLPRDRVVVTCHDLDAFRCLLSPADEPRSVPFRAVARRTLRGLQQASRVICVSVAVRDELARARLVPEGRLRVVPNGVDPVFSQAPDPQSDAVARRLLSSSGRASLDVLHVGSDIPRKRVDVLLEAFARVASARADVRLVRAGGLTAGHRRLARELGIAGRVLELPFLERPVLAAVYRRAAVTVIPSVREGFGLPVLESMACGVPVVASDLAALRETGGEAARYCPPGDAGALARAMAEVLAAPRDRLGAPGLAQAARFTIEACARCTEEIYREVSNAARPGNASAS